jgi:acetyl esterase/lipase
MKRSLMAQSAVLLAVVASMLAAAINGCAAVPATSPASASPATAPAAAPRIKLYAETPNVVPGTETDANPTEPTLDIYLPPNDKSTGTAVLICPGGGYSNLALDHEGSAVAKFYQSHNIAAFILRYRHGPRYHYPTTLLDSQRALRVIRSHAGDYRLDPDKLGILGFSAGGHLAAITSTLFNNKLLPAEPYKPDAIDALSAKPAFSILIYPVIDMTDANITHGGSRSNLTQNKTELYELLSPQLHVAADTPPVFLTHATTDPAVPVMNSILYYQACLKAKVPAEMHILEQGPHGFGFTPTNANPDLRDWPDQTLRFLARHKWIPAP